MTEQDQQRLFHGLKEFNVQYQDVGTVNSVNWVTKFDYPITYEEAAAFANQWQSHYTIRIIRISRYLPQGSDKPAIHSVVAYFEKWEK